MFRENNFQRALALLKADDSSAAGGGGGDAEGEGGQGKKAGKKRHGGKKGEVSDVFKLIRMCLERHYAPVIVFSFSKKDCESHAQAMAKLDFSDATERQLIDTIFANAISSLSPDDRSLPQVTSILPILRRGIGIHHSGLLPLLKEVIEILFQEGLLKCLFSTETFSMGLNMPAKTVVFTSVRKWDGTEFRVVSSGEYIQMSGRAGRRGLDERGIVIAMLDEALDPVVAKAMLKGDSDVLNSSFHLGYNMLLNLLRVEDVDPLSLMARSFKQFQSTRRTPDIVRRTELKEKERDDLRERMAAEGGEDATTYVHWMQQVEESRKRLKELWCQPTYVAPFLNPGRLAWVRSRVAGEKDWGWGVIVSYQVKAQKRGQQGDANLYAISVLVNAATPLPQPVKGKTAPYRPAGDGVPGELVLMEVGLSDLDELSSVRLILPKDVRERSARKQVGASLQQVKGRVKSVPTLSVTDDLKVKDPQALALLSHLDDLHRLMSSHPLHSPERSSDRERLSAQHRQLQALEAERWRRWRRSASV